MTWEQFAALAAIVGVPLTVLGIWLVVRQQARDQAKQRADERQATYNKGYEDGIAHVAPELNLMRSQRDDARRERDNERAERMDCDRQVRDLEAELRKKGGS